MGRVQMPGRFAGQVQMPGRSALRRRSRFERRAAYRARPEYARLLIDYIKLSSLALEAPIVAGLKPPDVRAADVSVHGQAAARARLADVRSSMPTVARAWSARLAQRPAARAVAPASLFGISLLLALCAAAWFTGGTEGDNLCGTLALCGWFLARASGRRLACSGLSAPARPGSGRTVSGGLTGSTDWLVLPGATWDDGGGLEASPARQPQARGGWPAAVCTAAAECAVYGGIAAGGQSAGWTGMWPLAVMAISAVAVRETVGRCGLLGAPASLERSARSETSRGLAAFGTRIAAIRRATGTVFALSAGTRLMLAAVALTTYGPRMALFVILAIEAISTCCAIVGTTRLTDSGTGRPAPVRPAVVQAGRDDGMAARWTGRLVRGQLAALPPALVGVSALVLLAVLGLQHLPGVLALTPAVVMMLAAPGSSHPHDGRFDWLTPVLLQIGQYLYLAALGFALNVPGPVVYSLCALTAIWYASLAADAGGSPVRLDRGTASPPPAPGAAGQRLARSGTGLGWEGRMFAVGLGAMLGGATLAYVALAAYLGVLVGRRVVVGVLMPREGDRR